MSRENVEESCVGLLFIFLANGNWKRNHLWMMSRTFFKKKSVQILGIILKKALLKCCHLTKVVLSLSGKNNKRSAVERTATTTFSTSCHDVKPLIYSCKEVDCKPPMLTASSTAITVYVAFSTHSLRRVWRSFVVYFKSRQIQVLADYS